jgi:hypothetical protein
MISLRRKESPMPDSTITSRRRRNIDKDASTYWLSHETRLTLRAIAKKRHLEPPALLEVLAEELAQKYLSPQEIAEIEHEAAAIRAKRQQEQDS